MRADGQRWGAGMRVGRNGSRLTLDLGPGFKENTVDEEANIRDAGSIRDLQLLS